MQPERHAVQFYEEDGFLVETVAGFLRQALERGGSAMVVATEPHRLAIRELLRDLEPAPLLLFDARELLAKLMVGGLPDGERFAALAAPMVENTSHFYGEMVDLLWQDGNREAALRLEELWNQLARRHSFKLLCSYRMSNFTDHSDGPAFVRLCGLHSHVEPTERYRGLEDDAEQAREVARLQQRAAALESEIERRKQLESELLKSQARLKDLLENAPVPMHWVDPEGKILWANRAELELIGYSPEEYLGRHLGDFHADRELIGRILGPDPVREQPARLVRKDGSIRQVLIDSSACVEDGRFMHTRCFTRDVTGRLDAGERRMKLLIDSIREYAIFMLDSDGRVSTWNSGAQRINGYHASEIIGRHFSVFYPPEDAGKCAEELRLASETGRFEDEGWRVRKDGTRIWANVVISAVREETGRLLGFAKITRDLTDRRRAEDERAARVNAEEANRAKDEFLAMLGHELRNPLAPIVTAMQLMKLRGDGSGKEQIIVERQVQHMVRLVDDLLDISRITQGKIELKKQSVQLAEVIAKAVEIASPLLEQRRHELSVDVPRQGLQLSADPVRLAQVFTNLLTNAARYTEPEGKIALSVWRDGHELVIQVKDNGVGIRAELLPRIFELFVQGARASDRVDGGLGIGLTLVRNLVQMHGGTVVGLSDGPGHGSAFVVRLPAQPSTAAENENKAASSTLRKSEHPRRMLIVDDNEDAALLLAELCTELGHQVKVAHDGPSALAALNDFTPEVAILDIGLPVMDGYELAKQMHQQLNGACRLIALTGYGQEHDRRRSERVGFEAHLVKPVDPMRVIALVERTNG